MAKLLRPPNDLKTLTPCQIKRLEKESTIEWNQLESDAFLITSDPREWRRMEKFGVTPCRKTDSCHWYKFPKHWLRVRRSKNAQR